MLFHSNDGWFCCWLALVLLASLCFSLSLSFSLKLTLSYFLTFTLSLSFTPARIMQRTLSCYSLEKSEAILFLHIRINKTQLHVFANAFYILVLVQFTLELIIWFQETRLFTLTVRTKKKKMTQQHEKTHLPNIRCNHVFSFFLSLALTAFLMLPPVFFSLFVLNL